MVIALFAGSFDPITNGHLDILKRAACMFSKVIVAVSYNIEKESLLPVEVKKELITKSIKEFKNIEVTSYEGLTANFCEKEDVSVIIRGVRTSKDFEYEMQMARVNKDLNENIETIFIPASTEYCHVSSSLVKEILQHGGDISKYTPKCVTEYFENLKGL